jgi:hypothetical protein
LLLFPVEKREGPACRPAERVVFDTVWAQPVAFVPTRQAPARRKIDWRRLSAEVRESVTLRSRSAVLLTSIAVGSAVVTAGGIRYFYAERQIDVPVRLSVPIETPPLLVSRVVVPLSIAGPPTISTKTEPVGRTASAASRRAASASSPRTRAYRGRLIIDSTPQGATVFINQRQVGVTPLELPRHPSGSHAVWVQRDGFQRWTAGVLVPADRITRVTARLERRH